MKNIICVQNRAPGEGKWKYLPSLLVALFLMCGCGINGVGNDIIIEGAKDTDSTKEEVYEAEADIEECPSMIVVHICGAVAKPGVYELEEGCRLIDAVAVAGGFTEDAGTDAINLASQVNDASRVYIPTREEAQMPEYDEMETNNGGDGLININTANEDRLTDITGIGATKAKNIVAYRQEHGSFKNTQDIVNVSGIGEGTYQKIKDQITVN